MKMPKRTPLRFLWTATCYVVVLGCAQRAVSADSPAMTLDDSVHISAEQTISPSLAERSRFTAPYVQRALESVESFTEPKRTVPPDFQPWWVPYVRGESRPNQFSLGVDWLVQSALQHSRFLRVVQFDPQIKNSQLLRETAAFDWTSFIETTYDDLNDPIGNTLTTGNNDDRFRDKKWSGRAGVRHRNQTGGEFDISQQIGRQRNNSIFLAPNPQGTSRLELNYTQPILGNAGRAYNQSRIVIASIDQSIAGNQTTEQIQNHLFKVTKAYWILFQARARYFQQKKLLQSATAIYRNLRERKKVDSQYGQILRAKSAVAQRQSEITRAATEIRNAETQLRMLVNDPGLLGDRSAPLQLADVPIAYHIPLSMSDSLITALQHRLDIAQAIGHIHASSTRLGVARSELLPRLDLVLGTYVAGLADEGHGLTAWSSQFANGRPGYTVGLQFDVPIGNRAAKARHRERQLELLKAQAEFENEVEEAFAEVEVAVREVSTTYREMVNKYQSMLVSQQETRYLTDRYQTVPGDDATAALMLQNLLESQERLADEEYDFVAAQVNYSVSLVDLRRAMGTLMIFDTPSPPPSTPQSVTLELPELPPATSPEDTPQIDIETAVTQLRRLPRTTASPSGSPSAPLVPPSRLPELEQRWSRFDERERSR